MVLKSNNEIGNSGQNSNQNNLSNNSNINDSSNVVTDYLNTEQFTDRDRKQIILIMQQLL